MSTPSSLFVPPEPRSIVVNPTSAAPLRRALDEALGICVPRAFDEVRCARWVSGVMEARHVWTSDFGGEQFSLGRAWYTHLEQGRSREYFADAAASDARVERFAPGLQSAMRELLAGALGARVRQRHGWCGPGVHIFPAGEKVSRAGGVVHFDLEGLTELQLEQGVAAVSLTAMLQAPREGGGLRVWNALYEGDEEEDETDACDELPADHDEDGSEVLVYRTGDAALIDSHRRHRIEPFAGDLARISATVHGAQVDEGMWEAWF
jgi:hypothetical protein